MATAGDFDEFINCEICFEVFDKPQSLTCRHIFCLKCVDRIKDASKIECPVCKVQSNVNDIKPDYRTVAMVDSYRKNITEASSAVEEKGDLLSKCEMCEDDGAEVSHKCETCELLLCDKCEASHVASDSDDNSHTTKAILALAGDTKTQINKTLKQLKTREEILTTKLSNRKKELNNIRQACDYAMKSITEKEENLYAKIKSHHDNLRKEVEKQKLKHVKKSKQECKSIEFCYHDVKSRQAMLNSWLQSQSDLAVADTAEQIQEKLQDIEKEADKSQELGESVENFTINVAEGNELEYDTNSSTKLIYSTNQYADGNESKEDGACLDQAGVEEASGLNQNDYTTAEHRDYKAEKTVTIEGNWDEKRIENIQQYNGHLYCMEEERILVYTEHLTPVKTIKLNHTGYVSCRAFVCLNNKYLITASRYIEIGLRVLDTDGNDIQRICQGEYYGLAIHNQNLYAYEYNINKVLIFEQTLPHLWNKIGEIYLDYNGNDEHKAKKITSFLMQNEQIYIADNTSIYHLDMKGKLKRKIIHGKDNVEFKNPMICGVDSKGNLSVAEPENKRLTIVGTDGNCYTLLLRGDNLHDIRFAYMGEGNECLWVAHYIHEYPKPSLSHLTKYKTASTMSIIM